MQILLVEDDDTIARELALRWRLRQFQTRIARTLAEAGAFLATARADLIVLDLGLPDGDGLQWLVGRRQSDSHTPVLILTAQHLVTDRVRGLRAGADDYLIKPFDPEELDARVDALVRRMQLPEQGVVRFGELSWFPESGRVTLAGQQLEFSPREAEVLGALVRRAPRMVAKRTLVDLLTQRNQELGDSAVEVYMSRIRRKLAGSGLAIRTMRGFGYLLIDDPSNPGGS
jgi:two-component system response regulator TctD